jgi:16S rRNA processing protein RimM
VPANPFVGVTLALILRPRGRRGEVAAAILTDFPQRLTQLREAYLWDGVGKPRRVPLLSCWLHNNQAIFHFEGCESIAEAERLRGLEVQVPLAERMPLPASHYYVTDLLGCEVRDRGGTRLGRVRDIQFIGEGTPGTPLLVIETPQGELLVPLADEFCTRIDTAEHCIEVTLPDGLHDLNR